MGRKVNLVGQVFNRLTVIEETDQRDASGSILWKCQCSCGNFTTATGTSLKKGHKKSCGCYAKEMSAKIGRNNLIDITGQKFGKLEVIKKVGSKKTPSGATKIFWSCKCECGNSCIVEGNALKSGNTKSCGCVKSFGEQKIASILEEYNIPFEREKIFDPNTKYRYDFYVNNEYVIEYDGKQHFQNTSWGNDKYSIEFSQQRDKEKNEYCFNNNIPIIRIPYTYYNKLSLEDLILETSSFVVEQTNQ